MMPTSIFWFVAMALLAIFALLAGCRLGYGPGYRAWLGVAFGFVFLGLWVWLQKNPMVAVNLIPVPILSRVEGVGAVPIFMLIVGIAWARSHMPRQRLVTILAIVLGAVFYLKGGLWMIQSTPENCFGNSVRSGMVMQTQDYSCVAAASATALNKIGMPTTESFMAELTQTRQGSGSTTLRAMDGINERLAGGPWRCRIVQPTYDQLTALPTPILLPLQFEPGKLHMVVLEHADHAGVTLADPMNGPSYISRPEFETIYIGQALVIDKTN